MAASAGEVAGQDDWLTDEDRCFSLREFTARKGHAHSATKNVILNLTKANPPPRRPPCRVSCMKSNVHQRDTTPHEHSQGRVAPPVAPDEPPPRPLQRLVLLPTRAPWRPTCELHGAY